MINVSKMGVLWGKSELNGDLLELKINKMSKNMLF